MGLTVANDPIGNPFASIIQDADGRCDNGIGTPDAVDNAGRRGFVDLSIWSLGETLPIGTSFTLPFSISVVTPPPPGGQVAVELRHVDGLKGLGVPVNNALSLDGEIITMHPNDDGLHLQTRSCVLRFGIPIFRRGDYDGSGVADITDVINTIGYLFIGTRPPSCLDAGDVDNSGVLDLTDLITLLQCLFIAECPGIPGELCERDPVESIDPGDGRPVQPAVSLGCEIYPNPEYLPEAACK